MLCDKAEHGLVEKLDGGRIEKRNFRNDPKRAAKIGEAAHAERPVLRPFRKLQVDPGRDGERALGARQEAGQVLIFRIR